MVSLFSADWNWPLILGIAGAAIALLASLTEWMAKRVKMRMLLVLAVLGFLVYTAQQLLETELNSARERLITDIQKTVHQTRDIVTELADRVRNLPLADLGVRLFLLGDDPDTAHTIELAVMEKGSVAMWERYARWLTKVKSQDEVVPCLSLTLNSSHHYLVGLIQAFLLTDEKTHHAIRAILNSGRVSRWRSFPDSAFLREFGLTPRSVGCVLFFDGGPNKLIGYADARRFVEELYVLQQSGQTEKVESTLNRPHANAQAAIDQMFASVNTTVVADGDWPRVVDVMLKEGVDEATVTEGGIRYLVRLQDIVKKAEQTTSP